MSEGNKAAVRRFMGIFASGDMSILDEVLASNFVDDNLFPEQPAGPEGMEDMIAEGDKVVLRWTATGTHQGEFMGVPATENKVTITGLGIDRLVDGKIVEHWEQSRRHGDDAADRSDARPIGRD